MKFVVIGAGAAGLSAGRHCLQQGHQVDIFEQSGLIGGTWNYTDCVEIDENGLPVHSSMYQGLRTNVPKETMCYQDVPYPSELVRSYINHEEVLDYIKNFAKLFEIEPHIQFYKQIVNVEPKNDSWLVEIEDIKTKRRSVGEYDGVMVCNGHFNQVFTPQIAGLDTFTGNYKHSHVYRSPEGYKDKKVLILGGGPSGVDIAQHLVPVAVKVFLSVKETPLTKLPSGVVLKPGLKRIRGDRAEFEDGSEDTIDEILFCTGYKFTFPFLSKKCGIEVVDNCVRPLYKHIINIEHPTMCIIGIPLKVCCFPLFDLQVQFYLATFNGNLVLPSKEDMMKNLQEELARKSHLSLHRFHDIGEKQAEHFDDLADNAKIKRAPRAISDLFVKVWKNRMLDANFKIIDDDTFVQLT